LQLEALWNPFGRERDILVGISFLKLFDMIPFPVVFSTFQFNHVLNQIDVIALASIQLGFHTRCLPIDPGYHGFWDTGDFRKCPFAAKMSQ
jgi:hypothetical protein